MTCCRPNRRQKSNTGVREFRANYHLPPLTEKFYSKYEHLETQIAHFGIKSKNIEKHMDKIMELLKCDPRYYSLAPRTANQTYGWIDHWATRSDDNNDRKLMVYPLKWDQLLDEIRKIAQETWLGKR